MSSNIIEKQIHYYIDNSYLPGSLKKMARFILSLKKNAPEELKEIEPYLFKEFLPNVESGDRESYQILYNCNPKKAEEEARKLIQKNINDGYFNGAIKIHNQACQFDKLSPINIGLEPIEKKYLSCLEAKKYKLANDIYYLGKLYQPHFPSLKIINETINFFEGKNKNEYWWWRVTDEDESNDGSRSMLELIQAVTISNIVDMDDELKNRCNDLLEAALHFRLENIGKIKSENYDADAVEEETYKIMVKLVSLPIKKIKRPSLINGMLKNKRYSNRVAKMVMPYLGKNKKVLLRYFKKEVDLIINEWEPVDIDKLIAKAPLLLQNKYRTIFDQAITERKKKLLNPEWQKKYLDYTGYFEEICRLKIKLTETELVTLVEALAQNKKTNFYFFNKEEALTILERYPETKVTEELAETILFSIANSELSKRIINKTTTMQKMLSALSEQKLVIFTGILKINGKL